MKRLLVLSIFSFILLGCRNEVPLVPTPKGEVEEVSPGVEFIVDGLDEVRASHPYIGLQGSGRPIEVSLKSFYTPSEVKAKNNKFGFNLSANQYMYVEGLNYFIYDIEEPQAFLKKGAILINRLQLSSGKKVLSSNLMIELPSDIDATSRYVIKIVLNNGGSFKDQRVDKSSYNPYDYELNVSAPDISVLGEWCPIIEKRMDEVISKYSYSKGFSRHDQSYKALLDIKNEVTEITRYGNDLGPILRTKITQLYKDEFDEGYYDSYLKEYNTLISKGNINARNNIDRFFLGPEDYALSMSLFKSIVLDINAPERIIELYRVRTQCMAEHASNVVKKVVDLSERMQKERISIKSGWALRHQWPFRYKYEGNHTLIFCLVEEEEILRNWLKVQREVDQYRANVVKSYNGINAKYIGIGLNWHNSSEGKNFFDLMKKPFQIYNYDIMVDRYFQPLS